MHTQMAQIADLLAPVLEVVDAQACLYEPSRAKGGPGGGWGTAPAAQYAAACICPPVKALQCLPGWSWQSHKPHKPLCCTCPLHHRPSGRVRRHLPAAAAGVPAAHTPHTPAAPEPVHAHQAVLAPVQGGGGGRRPSPGHAWYRRSCVQRGCASGAAALQHRCDGPGVGACQGLRPLHCLSQDGLAFTQSHRHAGHAHAHVPLTNHVAVGEAPEA